MQKINKIVLSVGVLSSAVALSASAQYATPTRPELRAELHQEVRVDIMDFKKERALNIETLRGEVKDMRDAMHTAIASGTVKVSTSTRNDIKNQIKEVRKEFIKERHEEIKDLRKGIKEDIKDAREEMRGMIPDSSLKTRLMATATIEALALRLGVPTSTIFDRVASGTKLKEIIGDKISRDEMAKLLPPMVHERLASSSESVVPKLLQKIFGARKETVISSIDENGEVVIEVKANVGFFRKLFGF